MRRITHSHASPAGGRFRRAAAGTAALAVLLSACAAPAPPPEPEPEHWYLERVVETADGMITLFDPRDLAHHAAEPGDWYRHRFALENDLETGRFAAVLTGRNGAHRVLVTSAPLDARERAVAGPQATQRLRVVDRRLLLAGGGDVWPSLATPRQPPPSDPRWFGLPNGDYEVTITALDTVLDPALPDIVFRLEAVDAIDGVAYAPGIPQLVVGAPPAVAGADTSGLRRTERCGALAREGVWSPLVDASLPLPGGGTVVRVSERLHERRLALQSATRDADAPIVIAREPVVGALGVQFAPRRWREPRRERGLYRELFEVEGRVLCAVRVTALDDGPGKALSLAVEPVPMPRDRLPVELARTLVERFETHVALASDPAWRYKSGRVRHAPDDTSRVLTVMEFLALEAIETETLLPMSNEARARWLLERMERAI